MKQREKRHKYQLLFSYNHHSTIHEWHCLNTTLTPQLVTSREQIFYPQPKWALVPAFFAPETRDTFSPGWWLQSGLKVSPNSYCARQR